MICKKYTLGHSDDQHVFPICIWSLCPQFLANFLRDESNWNIFCYNIWCLVLSSWNLYRAIKVKGVFCYSQQGPWGNWVFVNEMTFGKFLWIRAGGQWKQLGIQYQPLTSRREKKLEAQTITGRERFSQLCQCNKSFCKNTKGGCSESFQIGEPDCFHRTSFVQNLTLHIFLSGCRFISFNIPCNKPII